MYIIISNSKDKPIYEQIKDEIKNQIIDGTLKAHDPLPSMRSLAKDLRVSVITTKRAYNDLENEGFIVSLAGKGTYVAGKSSEFAREERLKAIEENLDLAVKSAKDLNLSLEELIESLKIIYSGD